MALMKAFRNRLTGRVEMFPDTPFWRNYPHLELVTDEDGSKEIVVNNEVLLEVLQEEEAEDG